MDELQIIHKVMRACKEAGKGHVTCFRKSHLKCASKMLDSGQWNKEQ